MCPMESGLPWSTSRDVAWHPMVFTMGHMYPMEYTMEFTMEVRLFQDVYHGAPWYIMGHTMGYHGRCRMVCSIGHRTSNAYHLLYGSLTGHPWLTHGSAVAHRWVTRGSLVSHPWDTRGTPVDRPLVHSSSPRVAYGSPAGHPQVLHGAPWYTLGDTTGCHRWCNGVPHGIYPTS